MREAMRLARSTYLCALSGFVAWTASARRKSALILSAAIRLSSPVPVPLRWVLGSREEFIRVGWIFWEGSGVGQPG